jgi:hypothetical protein
MKTYLTGDLHGENDFSKIYKAKYGLKDYTDSRLIQLGDFGIIWSSFDSNPSERMLFNDLNSTFGEVLFVDGNHENFDRLEKYPTTTRYGGKVRCIADRIYQLMRGEVYDIDGKTFFVMGGGDSIDKMYRYEGVSWWPREQPNHMDFENALDNLEIAGMHVDYVLTHTCPVSTKMVINSKMKLKPIIDGLENWLENIKTDVEFTHWYFGHFHIDAKVEDKFTCLYNEILELGEPLNDEVDDFKSGIMAPLNVDDATLDPTQKAILGMVKSSHIKD